MIKDRRMYTVFALMLATFLTAVDVTIVDTAMPRIVGSLGGFSLLTWVVTVYMLTSTATVPLYGKLADLYGRKITFQVGAAIFVLGSLLCALAQNMEQLILFRALQGLGAGAVAPVVQTIIADIFTPHERAKMQAWFSGVWGVSAVMGPLIGGLIVDFASWRYLFAINLPFGILAIGMIWRFLEEKVVRRKVQLDYIGSITMTLGITTLLMALLLGGTHYPWASVQIVGLFITAVVLLVILVWQEGRAPDPMLPLAIFKIPVIWVAVAATFMLGASVYGKAVYLPLWAQGVQGFSATQSGATLLWMSVGWTTASIVSSRLVIRMGTRPLVLLGLMLNLTGIIGLIAVSWSLDYIPALVLSGLTFMIGFSMGANTLAFILGVQNAVEWERRGVATASLQFFRTLGGLVWVAAMGGVMNQSLFRRLSQMDGLSVASSVEAGKVANQMLDPQTWSSMGSGLLEMLRGALADSLRNVFLMMLLAAVLALLIGMLLPDTKFDKEPKASK